MKKIKVEVCKRCSNFDMKELKESSREMNYKLKTGCIAKCKKKHPELSERYFGLINGQFISCDSKEEFFLTIKNQSLE